MKPDGFDGMTLPEMCLLESVVCDPDLSSSDLQSLLIHGST